MNPYAKCERCRDLQRNWGYHKEGLRYAARKCARRQSPALIEAVKQAKEQVADAANELDRHQREHEEGAA